MIVTIEHALLSLAFAIIAALYASVGQAGTGYIAIMGLVGYGPATSKQNRGLGASPGDPSRGHPKSIGRATCAGPLLKSVSEQRVT